MKDHKYKSNPKLDSMINAILTNSKFSSFQEYVEWRLKADSDQSLRGRKLI